MCRPKKKSAPKGVIKSQSTPKEADFLISLYETTATKFLFHGAKIISINDIRNKIKSKTIGF